MKTVVKWEAPCLERFIAHEARKYTRHGYDGRFPTAGREGDAPLFSSLVDSERGGTLRGRESALPWQRASYNPFRALLAENELRDMGWEVGRSVHFPPCTVTKRCPARQMG
ncbi:hypothetical protein MTO96_016618 [Rhipicephalus appendiculatus]